MAAKHFSRAGRTRAPRVSFLRAIERAFSMELSGRRIIYLGSDGKGEDGLSGVTEKAAKRRQPDYAAGVARL